MKADVEARVAARTRIADLHMQNKGWLARMANRTGLFIANTVDRLTGWADNDNAIFLGCTAAGLLRGSVYGALICLGAIGIVGLQISVPFFLTAMAAGALAYGIYDGQKGLEYHLNHRYSRTPDDLARVFGTLPGQPLDPNIDPELATRATAKNTTLQDAQKASFTAREDARRSEPQPSPQQR